MDFDLVRVARGEKKADLVVQNGNLVNVLTGEIYEADVAISGSKIAAVGNVSHCVGNRTRFLDADGEYLVPGLIDGHQHMECSKLSVTMFAKAVLPRGTTSIISGLDEIYVVAGPNAVKEFLNESKQTGLKIFWAAPFKSPYTPTSTVGYSFGPREHKLAQSWPECIGVWETVKGYILNYDETTYLAIDLAKRNRLPTFGSAARTTGAELSAYICAGIRADHESYSASEALEKLRNGLFVMIGCSSVTPHSLLKENLKIITEHHMNNRRIGFRTDDVTIREILRRGHLDLVVRSAIAEGVDPIEAIQMATVNCAEIYRIDHLVGSISPGRIADILCVDKPESFNVTRVVANGNQVSVGKQMVEEYRAPRRRYKLLHSIHIERVKPRQLKPRTRLRARQVRAISLRLTTGVPWVRERRDVVLTVQSQIVKPDVENDILYVTVVERYGKLHRRPIACVSGFQLGSGAMASSLSPDDNNVICVGTNVEDMALAINHIARHQGGQIVVGNSQVSAFLQLPIGGMMSDKEPEDMAKKEDELANAAHELGCKLQDPFVYLMVMPIAGAGEGPDYSMTDRGLVEIHSGKLVNPILGPA